MHSAGMAMTSGSLACVRRRDAVEIDAGRAAQLSLIPGVNVTIANFLHLPPRPVYDFVIMNPPFYGTHWMQHVMHAFEFLRPKGVLVAVLPVTAEIGESAQHEAFRAWVQKQSWRRSSDFQSLPPESFRESGTRINTVFLTMHKPS